MKEAGFEQVFKNKWNFAVWDLEREKKFQCHPRETEYDYLNMNMNRMCSAWLL